MAKAANEREALSLKYFVTLVSFVVENRVSQCFYKGDGLFICANIVQSYEVSIH